MLNANRRGGESDVLIHRDDRAAQGFRNKKVSDSFRLPMQENLPNFIQYDGWNQDRPFALQIRSKEVGLRVGGDIFQPARRIDKYRIRDGRRAHGIRPSISSLRLRRGAL